MNALLYILLAIAIVVGGYLLIRYLKQQAEARKKKEATESHKALAKEIHDLLYSVNAALEDGEDPSREEVAKLAADPFSRFFLYGALNSFGKAKHFPEKYFTHEASAESQLVYYLKHVHVLGAEPDEIELVEKYAYRQGDEALDYFVFKFKVNAPHPDASKGWMQAVVGPFAEKAHPYGRALATHSFKVSPTEKTSKEHVEYAHANQYPVLTDIEKKILQLT